MKLGTQNQNVFYVLPILAILVVLGIGIVFIQPEIGTIQELQAKNTELDSRKTQMQEKITQLQQLNENRQDIIAKLTAMDIALPRDKEVPNLVIGIQRIAAASDVDLQSIQLTPGKLASDSAALAKTGAEIQVNLAITGSYEATKAFLGKIYNAKRLLNVNQIAVNTNAESNDGNVNTQVILSSFYAQLSGVPKDVVDAVPLLNTADTELYEKLLQYETFSTDSGPAPTPRPQPSESPNATGSATTN